MPFELAYIDSFVGIVDGPIEPFHPREISHVLSFIIKIYGFHFIWYKCTTTIYGNPGNHKYVQESKEMHLYAIQRNAMTEHKLTTKIED